MFVKLVKDRLLESSYKQKSSTKLQPSASLEPITTVRDSSEKKRIDINASMTLNSLEELNTYFKDGNKNLEKFKKTETSYHYTRNSLLFCY